MQLPGAVAVTICSYVKYDITHFASLAALYSFFREVTRTNVFGVLSEGDDGRVAGAEIVISSFLLDDGELFDQSEEW